MLETGLGAQFNGRALVWHTPASPKKGGKEEAPKCASIQRHDPRSQAGYLESPAVMPDDPRLTPRTNMVQENQLWRVVFWNLFAPQ